LVSQIFILLCCMFRIYLSGSSKTPDSIYLLRSRIDLGSTSTALLRLARTHLGRPSTSLSCLDQSFLGVLPLHFFVSIISISGVPQSQLKGTMAPSLIRIYATLSIIVVTIQAGQMLAFAPVTALARWEGLDRRQVVGDCPAASQTLCPDHIGCCPRGAACTYSRDIPVCDESCNGGPNCPRGGCCQIGYVCGTTNNFCTPAATAHPKHALEAPVTTTSYASVITPGAPPVEHVPVSTPTEAAVESAPDTLTTTVSTTTTTPKQAAHELPHETESTTSRASTPTVRASSSHHVAPATATATTTTSHDGSKFVGKASGSETKAASPSAQATSSGATFVFVSGTNGFLVGMILGWLVSYCVLIQ
jgi:hypothetical protein